MCGCRLMQSGGPVLLSFLIGAVGMVLGALLGWLLLRSHLGPQAGCIAASLCSSYVGGSINFVAVSQVRHSSSNMFSLRTICSSSAAQQHRPGPCELAHIVRRRS